MFSGDAGASEILTFNTAKPNVTPTSANASHGFSRSDAEGSPSIGIPIVHRRRGTAQLNRRSSLARVSKIRVPIMRRRNTPTDLRPTMALHDDT